MFEEQCLVIQIGTIRSFFCLKLNSEYSIMFFAQVPSSQFHSNSCLPAMSVLLLPTCSAASSFADTSLLKITKAAFHGEMLITLI
jgi:hypothetical protein